MNTATDLKRCLAFINCQLRPASTPALSSKNGLQWRAVTISRQAGAGAHVVAQKLGEYLETHSSRWAVFDRNLVEKVLEDHHLPTRLAKFMPEDRVSNIQDTMDELFGLHPPTSTLVQKISETILHLAELGNVILIGRGANVVTGKFDNIFHVRLVGSLEKRAAYLQKEKQLEGKAALKFLHDEDRGRRRYLKRYFQQDIDNPLLYHMVLNTDLVGYDGAAQIIGNVLLSPRA
jgi:cytidylate kinase